VSDEYLEDPLGSVARRKLEIIFIVDTSGSMSINGRIQALNQAAHTVLPELKDESDKNPQADVHFRVLEFATRARWASADPKPMSEFGSSWHWTDLEAGGVTDFGAALDLLTDALQPEKLGTYNYPPVLVLLSDGSPTDDWESALERFNQSPFGRKAGRTVRAALAVTDADKDVLSRFTGNMETVVEVTNPTQMVSFLKWATVTLSKASSRSRAVNLEKDELPSSDSAAAPPLPPPPSPPVDVDDDVF
jgi:uncharacterized protein YegL